jgi:hypothetical protein
MKRTSTFLACATALLLAACTSDSQFPTPTGEGGVRGINAIPGSPVVTFRIEERSLGNLNYKNSSTPTLYDDFEYTFNFDILNPGDDDAQRIASVTQKVDDGFEYVFVVSGDLANPTVTTWETPLRDWGGSETVFEGRFAHLAESLGTVDVYFYEQSGPMPVQGEQVATLAFGDIMDITDFEEGEYRALITAAGDINTVYHDSIPAIFAPRSSHLISIFDGNENDTSPYILWSMSSAGQQLRLADAAYASTIRFVHGAATLPAVDIYDDETLTNLVRSNLALGETSVDIDTVSEELTWYFTPTGSTATVLFSQTTAPAPTSTPTDMYLSGTTDAWAGVNLSQDRTSAENLAKLSLYHSAFDAETMDMYIVARGETIAEDAFPTLRRINYGLPSGTAALEAGSYDIYLTELFQKTVVGGPYELDVALGDVVFLLAYDDELSPGSVIIEDVSVP